MRLTHALIVLLGVTVSGFVAAQHTSLLRAAPAQSPETMSPEQSAAKSKELIQKTIAALGGPAYLGVKDIDCTARLSQFGHSGDLTGYVYIRDLWQLPDKNRTEYSKKSNIIDVINGEGGWTLDKGGVTEMPVTQLTDFQEQIKRDYENLLRYRLNEEGMIFRYAGSDMIDLKQVDWAEVVDRERRTFRLGIDRKTFLPVRVLVITRNPQTRERTEELTYLSIYQQSDGVQTPHQVTREQDGRRVFQAFYSSCRYNTGLPGELFTKASLDKRWAELPKKKQK